MCPFTKRLSSTSMKFYRYVVLLRLAFSKKSPEKMRNNQYECTTWWMTVIFHRQCVSPWITNKILYAQSFFGKHKNWWIGIYPRTQTDKTFEPKCSRGWIFINITTYMLLIDFMTYGFARKLSAPSYFSSVRNNTTYQYKGKHAHATTLK